MTIILNVGIILIQSGSKVTTYLLPDLRKPSSYTHSILWLQKIMTLDLEDIIITLQFQTLQSNIRVMLGENYR